MTNDGGEVKGQYSQHQAWMGQWARNVAIRVRRQMFDALMALARPTADTRVLDVGVTSEDAEGMNFLEAQYPHPNRITATGMEDASHLEQRYPGLTFVRADGRRLPFPDGSFDLVVSSAVVEHVGSRQQQREFVKEMCRVGGAVCLTTPNRFFPLEFHTVMPLVHWLPPRAFRAIVRRTGSGFYAREETLNLLSESDLRALAPSGRRVTVKRFSLLGWTSNLLMYID